MNHPDRVDLPVDLNVEVSPSLSNKRSSKSLQNVYFLFFPFFFFSFFRFVGEGKVVY